MKIRICFLILLIITSIYPSVRIPKKKYSDDRCDWRKVDYDQSEYIIGTVINIDTIRIINKYKNNIRYLELQIDSVKEVIGSGNDVNILISQEISTINGGAISFRFETGKRYYFKILPAESYYKSLLEYEKEILKARKLERSIMAVHKVLEFVDSGVLIDYIKDDGTLCKEVYDPNSKTLEELE